MKLVTQDGLLIQNIPHLKCPLRFRITKTSRESPIPSPYPLKPRNGGVGKNSIDGIMNILLNV